MAVAFQLGIDNTSPTITYFPFSPNTVALNATAGWTPYYTNSGFPSTLGLVGDGTSSQISSKNGSFFSVTWFGASPFSLPRKSLRSLTSDRQALALISTEMQRVPRSKSVWTVKPEVGVLVTLWSTQARISSPRSQTYNLTRIQSL